jgi:putative superfamily III holin-X
VTASSSPAPNATPDGTHPAAPAATPAEPSIGQLVSDASTHLSTLIHGEIELAKLELRASVKNAGTGAGFFAAAAVLLLFSLVYGFQSLAEGIAALGVWRWLAFLIVFLLQVLLAALCGFLGYKKVKRVKAPERTLRTTKETVDYLKKSRG